MNLISQFMGINPHNKEVFDNNRLLIRKMNIESLFKVSLIGTVISGVYLLVYLIFGPWSFYLFEYGFVFTVMVIVMILAHIGKTNTHISDRILMYILYISLLIYCIIMGCFLNPEISSTAICVFMVALPLFYIADVIRVSITQIIVAAVFLCFVYFRKGPDIFRIDLLNIITFLAIAILVYGHTISSKMHEIAYRSNLEKKRDLDSLTGVLNRVGLQLEINQYIKESEGIPAALIFVDLDNFKTINDKFGHNAGDKILCDTVNVFKSIFREDDLYGRIGGDEFIIFLPQIPNITWVDERLDALIERMRITLIGDSGAYDISVSVGCAIYPNDGNDFEILYKNADTAMYRVKENGKSGYRFCDKSDLN